MIFDTEKPATQKSLAQLLRVSRQTIVEIENRGICHRRMTFGDWIAAYVTRLREQAAGRMGNDDELDLSAERARLAKEQADRLAMENEVTRKQLAPVSVLEVVLARVSAQVAAHLDGVPGRLRIRMPHWQQGDFDALEAEIAAARNIAAKATIRAEDLDGSFGDQESDT